MDIPRYTAEYSLYKSTTAYVGAANHAAISGDGLVPALAKCRNVRPGWLIENTLCGECAEFHVECNRNGCWIVQDTPYQWECWDWPAEQ
jgi:hypothetical protein